MTKDEALKLALEALISAYQGKDKTNQVTDAITAIKEALAQPEPNYKKALEVWLDKTEWVQETVKPHELGMHRADVLKQRIQEASPQRTWVTTTWRGLTDAEIDGMVEITDLSGAYYYDDLLALARAIEAKLKEKNT